MGGVLFFCLFVKFRVDFFLFSHRLDQQRFEFHERDFSWKKRPRPFAYHGEASTAVSDDTPQFFRREHTQVGTQSILLYFTVYHN